MSDQLCKDLPELTKRNDTVLNGQELTEMQWVECCCVFGDHIDKQNLRGEES